MSTIYKGNSPNNLSLGIDYSHRGGSPLRGSLGSQRPDQNLLNHVGLGISVLLHVIPGLAAQFRLVSCVANGRDRSRSVAIGPLTGVGAFTG